MPVNNVVSIVTTDKIVSQRPLYSAEEVLRLIDAMAYEMHDSRNDGWVNQHYKDSLLLIQKRLTKVLKE